MLVKALEVPVEAQDQLQREPGNQHVASIYHSQSSSHQVLNACKPTMLVCVFADWNGP